MFKNISWTDYGLFILITLLIYYATIAVHYYLNEIKQIFSGKSSILSKLIPSKKIVAKNIMQPQVDHLNRQDFTLQSENTLHPLVDDCMNDIKKKLQYAANNNLVRQEVIYSLHQLINKYPLIKDASFKSFIMNYILNECVNYCSIHLDEDELNGLWAN